MLEFEPKIMAKKVLICEDDSSIQEIMSIVLSDKGYEVVEDQGDEKAIILHKPDLIYLDLSLEYCSGADLAKKLKANPVTKNIPIVVVSGSSEIEKVAAAVGANDCLKKPFDIAALEAMTQKYTS